jgi:amino acid permease
MAGKRAAAGNMAAADGDHGHAGSFGGSHSGQSFSFVVTVAFALNYIIGSGFLTIPWAFSQTGFILGASGLVVLCSFAIAAAIFIIEAMARGDMLREMEVSSSSLRQWNGNNYQAVSGQATHFEIELTSPDHLLTVGRHKLEMPDLCRKFLGKTGVTLYAAIVSLYFYGTLWAYATVFASAFHAIFGFYYVVYLLIFAAIVVSLSMLDLTEQIPVQVAMAIFRILMLTIMIATIILSEVSDTEAFTGYPRRVGPFFSKVDFSKLYILLPIATYANIFHHSIPALSNPVADKTKLGQIFIVSVLVCCVAYLAIGSTLASYFDGSMKNSTNLNWATYVGCTGECRTFPVRVITRIISRFVVLFPAFDVASAYPLNAITLGNNLMTSIFPGMLDTSSDHVRRVKLIFRGIAAIPPIIGAFFVTDLSMVTRYTGLCGFAIMFVFPALLGYYSEKLMRDSNLPSKTVYGGWYSSTFAQFTTFVFGIFVIILVFVCNLMGY